MGAPLAVVSSPSHYFLPAASSASSSPSSASVVVQQPPSPDLASATASALRRLRSRMPEDTPPPQQQQQQQQLPPLPPLPLSPRVLSGGSSSGLSVSSAGGGGRGGTITMEIYADLVCPWCFIEKHCLESLIRRYRTQHPEVQFDVKWRPFYIVSGLKKGTDKRGMYERVRAPYPEFLNRIQAAGSKHDIAFSIRGTTGSTRQGHKLIALALQRLGPAGQSRVVEVLYQGHFEDGRDVSDEEWLVRVGVEAGIPEGVVRLELEDEDSSRRIDAEAEIAREVRGVEAVPCVTVQGKYKVGGFQEAHVFEGLFDKIRLGGEL